MIFWINLTCCLLTVGFGLFGFLAPRYTAGALDLAVTRSTMGLSELRASVGGLFVIGGLTAIAMNDPAAYVMLGACFVGAALGRIVSFFIDSPPRIKLAVFGGIEAALAAWLVFANI